MNGQKEKSDTFIGQEPKKDEERKEEENTMMPGKSSIISPPSLALLSFFLSFFLFFLSFFLSFFLKSLLNQREGPPVWSGGLQRGDSGRESSQVHFKTERSERKQRGRKRRRGKRSMHLSPCIVRTDRKIVVQGRERRSKRAMHRCNNND